MRIEKGKMARNTPNPTKKLVHFIDTIEENLVDKKGRKEGRKKERKKERKKDRKEQTIKQKNKQTNKQTKKRIV